MFLMWIRQQVGLLSVWHGIFNWSILYPFVWRWLWFFSFGGRRWVLLLNSGANWRRTKFEWHKCSCEGFEAQDWIGLDWIHRLRHGKKIRGQKWCVCGATKCGFKWSAIRNPLRLSTCSGPSSWVSIWTSCHCCSSSTTASTILYAAEPLHRRHNSSKCHLRASSSWNWFAGNVLWRYASTIWVSSLRQTRNYKCQVRLRNSEMHFAVKCLWWSLW